MVPDNCPTVHFVWQRKPGLTAVKGHVVGCLHRQQCEACKAHTLMQAEIVMGRTDIDIHRLQLVSRFLPNVRNHAPLHLAAADTDWKCMCA